MKRLRATPPSAPVGLEGLVAKWRALANGALRCSGTWNGNDIADRIEFMADELEAIAQQPAAVDGAVLHVARIGNYGAAYDGPGTCRAFTYAHQPGNVDAGRLGGAVMEAASARSGDSIDRGLALLKALQGIGFGVFKLAAQPGGAA